MTNENEDPTLEKPSTGYSITDFHTTAVLISQGFIVVKITKEGYQGKVKRFHFEQTPELDKVVYSYINGKLVGNIRDFRNAIETVKDMVYSSN